MLVRCGAEDQGVHREQGVEPPPRLINGFHDELRRELHRLGAPFNVGIAHLRRGHGPGVEPRVDDRFHPASLFRARSTRHEDLIDTRTMRVEVAEVSSGERRKLGERADAGEVIVGTTPNRKRRAPEAVAR